MKMILGLVLAAVVALGVAVYAGGDGCCMGGKAKGADKMSACTSALSKLDLTDQQKAKLVTLKEECLRATSTSEAHEKYMKGVQEVLTPEQFTQWKTECEKSAKGSGCPFMKSSAAKS